MRPVQNVVFSVQNIAGIKHSTMYKSHESKTFKSIITLRYLNVIGAIFTFMKKTVQIWESLKMLKAPHRNDEDLGSSYGDW